MFRKPGEIADARPFQPDLGERFFLFLYFRCPSIIVKVNSRVEKRCREKITRTEIDERMYLTFRNYRSAILVVLFQCFVESGVAAAAQDAIASSEDSRDEVYLLVAFVLLALVVSFMCSVAEAVLLSITPSYIEELGERNPKQARLLKRLREEKIDRSLAGILTMNTIAHTAGAIGAGAQAGTVFGSAWVGVFSAVMTLAILFLSEIIPKTLGAVYWPKLTRPTVFFVRSLVVALYPLVLASEWLTRLVTKGRALHAFNRDEFIAMINIVERSGDLREHESRIIRNLFKFGLLKASDIMTPRTVIYALPQDATIGEKLKEGIDSPFSRLPVYGKDMDDITGFVLKDDLLAYKYRAREDVKLESVKREIHAVPASISLPNLLEFLLHRRQHIVLAVDEHGGTEGIVTLEDVVETLLGMEIMDETDKVEDMRVLARRQWAKRVKALGLESADIPGEEQFGRSASNFSEK